MYAVDNTVPAVVVDFGSHSTKFGHAGEDLPHHIFPSRLGLRTVDGKSETFCGNDLLTRRDGVEVVSPFDSDALVHNWDDMERLIQYSIREIVPEELAFMIAEPSYNTRELREKMCELMFEKHRTPALYLGRSAVLSAFANNRTTGVVLDVGSSCVTAVPVFEGAIVKNKMLRSSVAGNRLNEKLAEQLKEKNVQIKPAYSVKKTRVDGNEEMSDAGGAEDEAPQREYKVETINFPATTSSYKDHAELNILEQVKEAICKVNDLPSVEPVLQPTETYELPDGAIVEMGLERHVVPEALFSPLVHMQTPGMENVMPSKDQQSSEGIPGLVYDVIQNCDTHMHKDMYIGVCLTGGTSNTVGLYERLTRELLLRHSKVRVLAATGSPERKFCAWTGGSILATFSEFQKMWLSKEEYEENGSAFVHKKCP